MPASSEFVALCRAQIGILTQALGASIAAVYLTQELVEGSQTSLVPVAMYPEGNPGNWPQGAILPGTGLMSEAIAQLPSQLSMADPSSDPSPITSRPLLPGANASSPPFPSHPSVNPSNPRMQERGLAEQRQVVMPLVHEEIVMGVLVARREDRLWQKWEQEQIKEIAKTLSLACVLDQRYQWLAQEHQQEQLIQRQQRDLMDNLLHQFRNSLTALQTFGKLIVKRLQPGSPNRDVAENLTRETERLRELSQQLEFVLRAGQTPSLLPAANHGFDQPADLGNAALDPSTAPQQSVGLLPGIRLPLDRCLIENILNPLLASTQTIAQEKGLTLHTQMPDELPPIWANPQGLREVLNNLLENAVKYTPTGGSILVQVEAVEDESWLSIAVTDTGFGIPAEDLPRIFERHFRGIQAQGTIPGSGLGLAIAQTLMTQMQGTLQVFSPALTQALTPPDYSSSPHPNPGTTFLVKLRTALDEQG